MLAATAANGSLAREVEVTVYRTASEWAAFLASDDGRVSLLVLPDDDGALRPFHRRNVEFVYDRSACFENGERLRAWAVDGDDLAGLTAIWPAGPGLVARVESIGPGALGAWLDVGWRQGVAPGDRLLHTRQGQPAARLDIVFATEELAYARIMPLARDITLNPGDQADLWPGPAERREGRASSAVCAVEERSGERVAWIAAPSHALCSPEPAVVFTRNGECVGGGVVEGRDSRFWQARLWTIPGAEVAVGDVARIRTLTDIAAGRMGALVFEIRGENAIVNAGEADGLRAGQQCTIRRRWQTVAEGSVARVQSGYSVVHVAPGAEPPQVGDEVAFGSEPPAGTEEQGPITAVSDETLFQARLASPTPVAAGGLMTVERAGRTVALAVCLVQHGDRVTGLALPRTTREPLGVDCVVVIREQEE
jgi:hypothetical protein